MKKDFCQLLKVIEKQKSETKQKLQREVPKPFDKTLRETFF